MRLALDHVVVVADSLAGAVRAWSEAGFTVTAGGRHDALPTENALVAFGDGSYVELLAVRDADIHEELRALAADPRAWERHLRGVSAIARRFLPWLVGPPGVADWVLRADSLARFATESRRRGFAMTGPVAMGRMRPDGVRLEWELLLPHAAHLPFLIADRTPRALRVPAEPDAVAHANGATGIVGVTVRVPDVAAAALELTDLLGAVPRVEPGGATALALAGITVRLAAGGRPGAGEVRIASAGALPPGLEAAGVHPVRTA